MLNLPKLTAAWQQFCSRKGFVLPISDPRPSVGYDSVVCDGAIQRFALGKSALPTSLPLRVPE